MSEIRLKVATVWRGEWNADVAYNALDEVSFSAEADGVKRGNYRSLLAANREPLSDENAWVLVLDLEKTQSATEEAEGMNEAFASAESGRVEAENKRVTAENGRVEAESKRASAESSRVEAEGKRVTAESGRNDAETNRRTAEETRISNEQARESAENSRTDAETNRRTAETVRISNEQARVSAENSRVAAEAGRANAFAVAQNEREEAFNEAEAGRDAKIDAKLEDITRLQGEVAKKANVDGYYSSMAVGAAESLIGQNVTTQQFTYQPSGNNWDVQDGLAIVKSIKGNTVVANQLVNGNGTLSLIRSRKYFCEINGVKSIITAASGQVLEVNESDIVVDLTKFFNVGNEPATVEEFERLYPNLPTEYNAGSLLNLNADSIKSVGFNRFDKNTVQREAFVNSDTLEVISYPKLEESVSSYIRVIPNETYYVENAISTYHRSAVLYDKDKKLAGRIKPPHGSTIDEKHLAKGLITIPENVYYIRFGIYNEYLDSCVFNLSHSGYRNGEYEPYKESIVNLPIKKYFTDGMKSAGEVRDELIWDESIKKYKAIQRIGTRVYQTGDEDLADIRTDKTNTYYKLATPIETIIDDYDLIDYEVSDFGTEEIIADEPTTPIVASIVYGVNAVDTLNRLPKTYISIDSMRDFLAQLGSVMNGNWAMEYDEANNKWAFAFAANVVVNNEE